MENLINKQKSLIISSLNINNIPEASYAPYVIIENDVYVYLSKAANHYYNLEANKNCSILIIEDEENAKTIFARERVSFVGEANKVNEVEEVIFEKFNEIHDAKMIAVLRTMDFDMFRISLKSGRYVKGFGKAYDVIWNNGEFELTHINDIGHK